MKSHMIFLLAGCFALGVLSGCETMHPSKAQGQVIAPCADWASLLGQSHECSYADGGALSPDRVRAEITQKVVRMGQPLPNQDYGLAVLIFNHDGTYQARKLKFTGFYEERRSVKNFLVYAEDSRGTFRVENNGVIALNTPQFSTCDERKKASDRIFIYPHVKPASRFPAVPTIVRSKRAIVFETQGWLGEFLGRSYWDGEIESRGDFAFPPFPTRIDQPLVYGFDGFQADIHYGCLEHGFAAFKGLSKEAIVMFREFRYTKDILPNDLRPGTRMIVLP